MNVIEAKDVAVLKLGFAGEKDRTVVRFYYGDVASEFPGGFVTLQVRRPCESDLYVVALDPSEDGYALWTVGSYDAAIKGIGECQLTYATSDNICKKKVWRTSIDRSLEGTDIGIPPDWETVTDKLLNAAGELSEMMARVDDQFQQINERIDDAENLLVMAKAAADKAGYMNLHIDNFGHLIYTRSVDVNVNFALDSNGHLVLTHA